MGRAGSCPVVIEACSCPSGGQSCAQADCKPLACWWVGQHSHPFLLSDLRHPALEPADCWAGMTVHSSGLMPNGCYPELLLPLSLTPLWARAGPTSAGDPPILASRSGTFSYGVLFPLGFCVHETLCVPSKSIVSISPSLGQFIDHLVGFQKQVLLVSPLLLLDPRLEISI